MVEVFIVVGKGICIEFDNDGFWYSGFYLERI